MSYQNWPYFNSTEINKVKKILESGKINYWTGNEGKLFEREYAKFCNVKHAVAVANGTIALELALKAIGISRNDEVIVPSCTYVATASAVLSLNARPVFSDIDQDTLNLTVKNIEKCLTKKTKAIIVVHLGGCPCDMDEIIKFAKKQKIKVIEDCSQAHGAKYKNMPVGSFGALSTWSFCQDKIISTAGEGGMVTTNSKKYRNLIWRFKDHGKSEESLQRQSKTIGFKWIHNYYGSNYRMTEIQSAIGRLQLKKITATNMKRKRYVTKIIKVLKKYDENIRIPKYDNTINHAWYRCYVFIESNGKVKKNYRDNLLKILNDQKIPCIVGSCAEVYREKVFKKSNLSPLKRHKIAKKISDSSIAFIVNPDFSNKQILSICRKLDITLNDYFFKNKFKSL